MPSMPTRRVAVLITSHNRKQQTLRCLQHLNAQRRSEAISVRPYLVDDGCTDGTGAAVREAFPNVTIVNGSGSLFWAGGMRRAFGEAAKDDPDFYLWLNDDTFLYEEALKRALDTYDAISRRGPRPSIIVGSTHPAERAPANYGGRRSQWWRPLHYQIVQPVPEPIECTSFNGNFVLIPRAVARAVGNLSVDYKHSFADIDYGIRAKKTGCGTYVMPGFAGICADHARGDVSALKRLSLRQLLGRLNTPKSLMVGSRTVFPFHEWKKFCRSHGGVFWFIYFLWHYRGLLPVFLPSRNMNSAAARRR